MRGAWSSVARRRPPVDLWLAVEASGRPKDHNEGSRCSGTTRRESAFVSEFRKILGVSRQNKAPRRRRALVPDLRALPALHRHAVRAPGSPRVHRPSEMGKKAKGKHRLGTCGFPQSMRRADPKSPRSSTTAAAAPTVVLVDRARLRVVRVWCLCVGPPITGTASPAHHLYRIRTRPCAPVQGHHTPPRTVTHRSRSWTNPRAPIHHHSSVPIHHPTDKFYYLAKEQGYRSRASFKLVQLNRKYDFFSGARACMDLCAAPGGWLQVAAKYMPMSSLIVGVDLAPIKPIRGCTTFVDDITTQSCRAQLKRCTPDGVQYDVVIHDGAPNVGGNFAAESYTQAALTLDSLRLATEFLKQGGWFITKVFRSTEYHALLYSMQQLFTKVESTKPVASRGTSAEIYVVCSGFLAPKKVDNRLLDPRHLFAEYEGPKQAIDVLSHAKRPRNRSGYEDGVSSLYKETPVETFILCDKPAELLGQFHAFLLDASVRFGW